MSINKNSYNAPYGNKDERSINQYENQFQKCGNQTQLDCHSKIIGSNVTNILTQYSIPSKKHGVNLLDDANVENAKIWVDENHK